MHTTQDPLHTSKGKRGLKTWQPRVILVVILWIMIFMAAHPEATVSALGNSFWKVLAPLGLDVAMTPLTYDMTLMYEQGEKSYYQRQAVFQVQRQEKWESLAWNELSFYGVRVPALLMFELVGSHVNVQGHVHGICYQLQRSFPDVQAFQVSLMPSSPHDEKLGLGKSWSCR